MTKIEYKTITIKASPGFQTEKGIKKFDETVTKQLNEIGTELGADGWELLNIFSVSLEGLYSLVFKRAVKELL